MAIGLSLFVRSDTATALPATPLLLFFGFVTDGRDRAYEAFVSALRREQPALSRQIVTELVAIPDDDDRRMAQIVRAAARRQPTALIAPNAVTAGIVRAEAPHTTLIFSSYLDPLRAGLVSSMRSRPEPVTGISVADWLDGKRLEILRDAFPETRTVAILADRSWAEHYDAAARLALEARHVGLDITILFSESASETQAIFDSDAVRHFDAWYIPPTYVSYRDEQLIIQRLRALGRPAIHSTVEEVLRGGQLAYAQDTSFVWPALATLVARVVAGESPGAIPIERPRRFVLAARIDSAGRPPPSVDILRRADVVID